MLVELRDKNKRSQLYLSRQLNTKKTKMSEMKGALESKIDETNELMHALLEELVSAEKDAKISTTAKARADKNAQARLHSVNVMSDQLRSLQDSLAKEYHSHKKMQEEWTQKCSDQQCTIQEMEEEIQDLYDTVHMSTPKVMKKYWTKNATRGGTPKWPSWVVEMVLELLSHRTPPACISANILTVASILFPNGASVLELPSTSFVRECRTLLVHTTKTLAAYTLGKVDKYDELFNDGTSRRQTSIENVIIGYMTENGFKTVTLSTSILAEDETAQACLEAVMATFKEGRDLLQIWRDATQEMFPTRPDLLELLPEPKQLTTGKLSKSGVMTDTCAKARKCQRLFAKSITEAALELGIAEADIKIYELDCWHHLRNIWLGAVTKQLSKTLDDVLEDCLGDIPWNLRVTTDIIGLLMAGEKEFSEEANYAKGHGSMFHYFMKTYHPDAYLYPFARSLGGARQDLGTEGAMAFYMNLPYLVAFLNDRLSIKADNILQRSLFTVLRSSEMIALLRVLSIVHIAITLPTRWLAGNTEDLSEFEFGVLDMGIVVDLLEKAMISVSEDGELLLDEDFMMNIFSDIGDCVDPFADYITHLFEEKQSNGVSGSRRKEDKVLPFDLLRAELFYPTRAENRQTHDMCCRLAVEIATTILMELRDLEKATHKYLTSAEGMYSSGKITEADRRACMNMMAHNSISESNHASSTAGLKVGGTIRLDHSCGEGQTRANNDFGRGHLALVTGKKKKSGAKVEVNMGTYHTLPEELKSSLIHSARVNASRTRKAFDDALKRQRAAIHRKEKLPWRKADGSA